MPPARRDLRCPRLPRRFFLRSSDALPNGSSVALGTSDVSLSDPSSSAATGSRCSVVRNARANGKSAGGVTGSGAVALLARLAGAGDTVAAHVGAGGDLLFSAPDFDGGVVLALLMWAKIA